jgi:hypothetical protein
MAKAKKTASKEETPAASAKAKSPGKKPASAAKSAKGGAAAPSAPLIDTSLAAQTAAKLVARRDMLEGARNSESRQESSSFRQMKESMNKPASQAPASFLQNTAPQKKSNTPFSGFNQVGKGQTFGADVNRSGVPRRTGG